MKAVVRAAWWLVPVAFFASFYWLGLRIWFHQDDFAWLNLSLHVRSWTDLWEALFAPRSFGTIRPLSERSFFLSFYALFGLDAVPFRIAVHVTQFANLILLARIAQRLTGSRLAGMLAALFWAASSVLAAALAWTSSYNQILCALFLLLSLYWLIRYAETGRRGYWIAQWMSFLAGFGALEINVVYPVIAAAYAWFWARAHFRKTLWLFPPSILYAVMHQLAAPKPESGVYAPRFDATVLTALWRYWEMALGPSRLTPVWPEFARWELAATTALGAALLGFVAWHLARRRWRYAFPLIWFLALLGPFLPFSGHVSDYYLAAPMSGLAVLGAWAVASGWNAGGWRRGLAIALAGLYLAVSLPTTRTVLRWHYERGRMARTLVYGLARAKQLHPGKTILLTGVSTDLFWTAVFDKPYRLLGLTQVYLAPGAEENIKADPELGDVSEFVLPPSVALEALERKQAVVYDASGDRLANVTGPFYAVARRRWSRDELPRRVDAGNALFSRFLGPEWYPVEDGYRWMPQRATVRLGGPARSLRVRGYCPSAQVAAGPLYLTVRANGYMFPRVELRRGDAPFDLSFRLPDAVGRASEIRVALEVDRIFARPEDGRPLGLVFGAIEAR
ncbi:MAG: hypothetical protein RMK57_15195 [Bryobacterales bacterium]|nr:hypothetical protein [Bryobacterales bacterium]